MERLSNLSVCENHLGVIENVGSQAPPPEIKSEVSPQNLSFNKFQKVCDQTFRSLDMEVPQPWWWLRGTKGLQNVGSSYYKVSMYPWVQMFSFNPLSTVTNKLLGINKGSSYSKVQGLPWQLLYSSLWHLTGRWREYERRISFPYLLWEFLRDLEWKEKELGSPTGILYGQSCSLLTQSKAVAPGNL